MNTQLKVGDSVTWMHYVNTNGTRMRFTNKEGKITQIDGGIAWVKLRSGRKTFVTLKSLRLASEKSMLTEMMEEMGKATPPVR